MATDALFVLALEQAPLREDYRAGPIARQGAALDKRNALLQLLMIADAARRLDYPDLFGHADLLAAAHPNLGGAVLAPLFDHLGEPGTMRIVGEALATDPHWAAAFRQRVPQQPAALRNYLALRRQAGLDRSWPSDEALVAVLAKNGMFTKAFGLWRQLAGSNADRFGFVTDSRFAPIGWQLTESGNRAARIGADGSMFVWVQRGGDGMLARQLLQLAPGRYRLETGIDAGTADPALTIALQCVGSPVGSADRPLAARTEFTVGDADCPAYWLTLGASALDSRHDVEATLRDWRFSRISG